MIQALSGSEVIPAMWTRRVASSITNSTTLARQTRRDPHLHGKEIGGGKDVPVRFQKLPPGRAFLPLGRWLNPVLLEDGSDGPASHVVAQIRERPLNACVTPIAILRRHTHHQLPNLGDRRRPSGSAALMAVVLPRDEMPMPGEEGARINPILRGWVQYFAFGHSGRCFSYIRDWVEKKIRHHLARASQRHGFGWKRWSRAWLYGELGLFHDYRVAY